MPQMSKQYMAGYCQKNKPKHQHKCKHTKHCEACDAVASPHYWSRHVATAKHKENEAKRCGLAPPEVGQPDLISTISRLRIEVKQTLAQIKRLESKVE